MQHLDLSSKMFSPAGGFIPAPFAVTNIRGLKTAAEDEPDCRFMSLFQRMSVSLQPGDSSASTLPL